MAQVVRKLRPVAGGLMTVLSTETHSYAVSGGVKREEIRTTATGSPHTHLEISETWTGEAAEPLNRGRLRMSQGVDGVQRWYSYAPDYQHGAIYTITEETRVEGEPVAGQSRRRVSFVNAAGNTVREEEFLLLSDGTTWVRLSGATHSYTYNHLGQITLVTDASGVRTLGYNAYGEQEMDSLLADGKTHLITETRDVLGRSTGFTYAKDGTTQHTVTTGYGAFFSAV